jgi:hypothetical protein
MSRKRPSPFRTTPSGASTRRERLSASRSEFFARAAERWLVESLDDDDTTDAINRAIAGLEPDHHFTDIAAAALASSDPHE